MLLEPIEKEINGKKFILSKFPAVDGRAIVINYPLPGMPYAGDYKLNEAAMFRLMSFVAVVGEGGSQLRLSTPELVNNHLGDWEMLMAVENEMIKYNCSFFK